MSLREPCRQCPWRRSAGPGFLGPHSAGEWVEIAHADGVIACHETITRDGEYTEQCRGAAIYRANVCKLPRNPEVERADADRETVFATPTEFKEHHE